MSQYSPGWAFCNSPSTRVSISGPLARSDSQHHRLQRKEISMTFGTGHYLASDSVGVEHKFTGAAGRQTWYCTFRGFLGLARMQHLDTSGATPLQISPQIPTFISTDHGLESSPWAPWKIVFGSTFAWSRRFRNPRHVLKWCEICRPPGGARATNLMKDAFSLVTTTLLKFKMQIQSLQENWKQPTLYKVHPSVFSNLACLVSSMASSSTSHLRCETCQS